MNHTVTVSNLFKGELVELAKAHRVLQIKKITAWITATPGVAIFIMNIQHLLRLDSIFDWQQISVATIMNSAFIIQLILRLVTRRTNLTTLLVISFVLELIWGRQLWLLLS